VQGVQGAHTDLLGGRGGTYEGGRTLRVPLKACAAVTAQRILVRWWGARFTFPSYVSLTARRGLSGGLPTFSVAVAQTEGAKKPPPYLMLGRPLEPQGSGI
jgi:hypothetical protein